MTPSQPCDRLVLQRYFEMRGRMLRQGPRVVDFDPTSSGSLLCHQGDCSDGLAPSTSPSAALIDVGARLISSSYRTRLPSL